MSATTEYTALVSRAESERDSTINSRARYSDADYSGTYEKYFRPVLAELVATMMFVCVGVLCVQYAGFTGVGSPASTAMCVAVGHGLTIALLVTAFGDISGGHVNPAVTLGAMLAGAIQLPMAALYVIAQLAGGLLGAGLTRVILSSHLYQTIGGGAHTLGEGVTPGQGILCEVVLTTVLVLTVLVSAVDPRTKSPLAPIAIGFAVVVDILAGLQITGASMNPARSLGPAVVISSETSEFWKYHYVYWAGPLAGSLVAGVFYRLLFASQEKRLVLKA